MNTGIRIFDYRYFLIDGYDDDVDKEDEVKEVDNESEDRCCDISCLIPSSTFPHFGSYPNSSLARDMSANVSCT